MELWGPGNTPGEYDLAEEKLKESLVSRNLWAQGSPGFKEALGSRKPWNSPFEIRHIKPGKPGRLKTGVRIPAYFAAKQGYT